MARIAGVDLPKQKRIEIALTYLYGIGPSRSRAILGNTGVDPDRRAADLTDDDVNKLRLEIEGNYKVEGALRTEVSMNIKRLMDIGCYRGLRPRRGLPVRGPRTHTNARPHKGQRRPIAGKQPAPKQEARQHVARWARSGARRVQGRVARVKIQAGPDLLS